MNRERFLTKRRHYCISLYFIVIETIINSVCPSVQLCETVYLTLTHRQTADLEDIYPTVVGLQLVYEVIQGIFSLSMPR